MCEKLKPSKSYTVDSKLLKEEEKLSFLEEGLIFLLLNNLHIVCVTRPCNLDKY